MPLNNALYSFEKENQTVLASKQNHAGKQANLPSQDVLQNKSQNSAQKNDFLSKNYGSNFQTSELPALNYHGSEVMQVNANFLKSCSSEHNLHKDLPLPDF